MPKKTKASDMICQDPQLVVAEEWKNVGMFF
jgi:hypothetical protein